MLQIEEEIIFSPQYNTFNTLATVWSYCIYEHGYGKEKVSEDNFEKYVHSDYTACLKYLVIYSVL